MIQDEDTPIDTIQLTISDAVAGMRLDKAVAELCPEYSRTRLQNLIDAGECLLNGHTCTTPSRKVEEGDVVILSIPQLVDADPTPENIPLDIIYEDDDVLVVNKPAGMVVHPAVGNYAGTLVNALLYHCGDSLSGINGVKRPGIVHRLDKDTSGLMMVAKNDMAHHALSEQLQDRSLSRVYRALVLGAPVIQNGKVDAPIGRHPTNRLKMAVVEKGGKDAETHFSVLQKYDDVVTLIECRLKTGRTHQIRVHMEHLGFPLIGDPLYGVQSTKLISKIKKSNLSEEAKEAILAFPRQALHAAEISFIHPNTGEEMHFSCALPDDFEGMLTYII